MLTKPEGIFIADNRKKEYKSKVLVRQLSCLNPLIESARIQPLNVSFTNIKEKISQMFVFEEDTVVKIIGTLCGKLKVKGLVAICHSFYIFFRTIHYITR